LSDSIRIRLQDLGCAVLREIAFLKTIIDGFERTNFV